MPTIEIAIVHGALGGLAFFLFKIYQNNFRVLPNPKIRVFTRSFLGGLAGLLWFEMGLPNSVNFFLAGALAPEIFEGVFDTEKKRMEDSEDENSPPRYPSDIFKARLI